MSAVATTIQAETLVLPATKLQPLRLALDVRDGSMSCAAYVRSRPFSHVVFACVHRVDEWRIAESCNGDCLLWIGHTAFDLDPKHADKVRAFLAHTKAGR
jgi:hypothetical protein